MTSISHHQTTMNILYKQLRRHNKNSSFTLIELMVVVAIIGLLAAAAIPKYLEARKAAAAGAIIGEKVGLAKECATFVIAQVGAAPTVKTGDRCNLSGGEYNGSWAQYGGVTNLKCMGTTATTPTTQVRITISSLGDMVCTLS